MYSRVQGLIRLPASLAVGIDGHYESGCAANPPDDTFGIFLGASLLLKNCWTRCLCHSHLHKFVTIVNVEKCGTSRRNFNEKERCHVCAVVDQFGNSL